VLDGAHDIISAQALRRSIKSLFPEENIILLLGISQDKDIEGIGRELIPLAGKIIFTDMKSPRAAKPEELQNRLGSMAPQTSSECADSVEKALALAKKEAGENDVVLVTGSLYLVGEAMGALGISPG
jgi:dihydrofolate synthase/folylpolyglutamate synthase